MIAWFYQPLRDHFFGGGLARCHSLIGDYEIHGKFVYIEDKDDGIKVTATDGTWKAHDCKNRKKERLVVLEGNDVSNLKIEILIDNNYEHIADRTMKYSSEITIGNDGWLVYRRLHSPADNVLDTKTTVNYERNLKVNSDIPKKYERSTQLINDKFRVFTKDKTCIPTLGIEADRYVLVFVCDDYTKVMKRSRSG